MTDLLNAIIDGKYDLVVGDILKINTRDGEDAASAKVLQLAMEAANEGTRAMMAGDSFKASKLMGNFTLAMGKIQQALKDVRLGIKPEVIQEHELLEKLNQDFEEPANE